MKKFRVVFAGTAHICVPFLEQLIADPRFELDFIITKRDNTRANRENLSRFLSRGLYNSKVWTPESIVELDPSMFSNLDASIVIAYGQKVPSELLNKTVWINMHASLLPKLRGAAPIQRAIMLGMTMTGLSATVMVEKIDSGPVIDQIDVPILPDDTSGTLCDRMMQVGPKWFTDTVASFLDKKIAAYNQNDAAATFAPPIAQSDQWIDWSKDANSIRNQVRALMPDPGCSLYILNKRVKLLNATVVISSGFSIGQITTSDKLVVCCGNGSYLRLNLVLPEGGKVMSDEDFCRGRRIVAGTYVSNRPL